MLLFQTTLVLASMSGIVNHRAEPIAPHTAATLYPLSSVRLLPSDFTKAVDANRTYLLALDPDRLIAPFRREAGLAPKKPPYGNWESMGVDGHTGGHYLSALAEMVASGQDTKTGELKRRLNYMVDELAACQAASPDGYVGGVPGSRELWTKIAAGDVQAIWPKWVPWYTLHKTYAGLRDAYLVAGNAKAKAVLIRFADWAEGVTKGLSDAKMQEMLGQEHGGMNETFADVYAMTGDEKYLKLARRFSHQAILGPLEKHEDRLTGLHANTQIPKVIGFERIASLTGDTQEDSAARFFWENVTQRRSVPFGGNSVSEHFNDPKDFQGLVEHREGPETCNTYNMLRLTEGLFPAEPQAKYADYYERALYNHILASINPKHPGYVYFTPLRPGHYRVYSQPDEGFWCCVGTGMENPGRYGKFIYAKAKDGVYVNLFIPSELKDGGLTLRQETRFPDEGRTRLSVTVPKPTRMTLYLRHPRWVAPNAFAVRVNGKPIAVKSTPSSYAAVTRTWKTGDRVEIALPMRTTVERLPDGSDWVSILRGPIVLASPTGTQDQTGLLAGAGRGDHIADGPLVPLDQMPALLSTPQELPKHVVADPAGSLRFRLKDVAEPAPNEGLPLMPFYRLQESRYQMVWSLTTPEKIAERKAKLAEEERIKIARDQATIDRVAVGEQQPEVDHVMKGEGLETGVHNGRRWRHGTTIEYTLDARGEKTAELEVTYSGDDNGRTFDVYAGDVRLATQTLKGERRGGFFDVRYPIPAEVLKDGKVTVRFVGKPGLAGGLYDVRLMRVKP